MLNKLAFYCGLSKKRINDEERVDADDVKEEGAVEFLTREEDHWTIVDISRCSPNENAKGDEPGTSENEVAGSSKRPRQTANPRRSKLKAARQAFYQMVNQPRKQKKQRNDLSKSNKSFQKMRKIVHQPRKQN